MKVTLDLSKLLEERKLTQAEAERLRALAAHDTGSLAINVLVGFGVIAVSPLVARTGGSLRCRKSSAIEGAADET
jgi:hypothetical protein